jgi:hypothetical protein
MRIFKDGQGREWTLAITIGAVKRLKAALEDVDLTRIGEGDPPLCDRLTGDVILLCDVLFCLVKAQAESLSVDEAQFAELLGGDVLRKAILAFWGELTDFFRDLDRPDVARLTEARRKLLIEVFEQNAAAVDAWEQKYATPEAVRAELQKQENQSQRDQENPEQATRPTSGS